MQPQPPRQATTCARSPSAQPCARPSPPAPPRSSLARVRTLRLQTIPPMDRRLRKTSTLDIGTEYCPRRPPMPVHAGTDRRIAVCIAPSLAAAASDTPTPSPHRARPAAAALTYPAETVTPTGMPTTLSVPRSSGTHRGTPMVVRACYGGSHHGGTCRAADSGGGGGSSRGPRPAPRRAAPAPARPGAGGNITFVPPFVSD